VGPSVSVVIPSRADARHLRSAVGSALRQSCDLEVLVVLSDPEAATAATLARSWPDPRVRLVVPDGPAGVADARNLGVRHARGGVIAFLDASDVWFANKLELQLAALEAARSSWGFGSALLFSADRTLEALLPAAPPDAVVEQLPSVNTVPGGGSNVIVTRGALEAVGGFDPAVPHLEDWDLWIRLAQHDHPAVIDETVVASRHGAAVGHRELTELLAAAGTLDERYRALRGGRSLDWADLHRWLCHDALRLGPRTVALRLALRALRWRDPGAVDLALRSMLPVRRRPPVRSAEEVNRWIDRRFPPRVVPWPAGTEAELASLLDPGGSVR
jgi:glycosyltransferase involved in cell wall biosynthesis